MRKHKQTTLVTAGRKKEWTNGVVNPPVQRASTVVFDTVAQKNQAAKKYVSPKQTTLRKRPGGLHP